MDPFLVQKTTVTKRISNCAKQQIRDTHAGHVPQEDIGAKLLPGEDDEQQGQVGDDGQDADHGNGNDDRGTVQGVKTGGDVLGGNILGCICRRYRRSDVYKCCNVNL